MKTNAKDNNLLNIFRKQKYYSQIIETINSEKPQISIKNFVGSSKSILLALLQKDLNRQILLLTQNQETADDWYYDLKQLINEESLAILTEEKHKFSIDNELTENFAEFVEGLDKSIEKNDLLLITTSSVLEKKFPKPDTISKNKMKLFRGETLNFVEFTKHLMLNGFQKEVFVAEPGDISIRGGIVDIFPIGWNNPLRIEFWDDDIDSIREFDPLSQRSIREYNDVEFIDNMFDISATDDSATMIDYMWDNALIVVDTPESFDENIDLTRYTNKFQTLYLNGLTKADIEVSSENQSSSNSSILSFREELKKLEQLGYDVFIAASGKIHLERLKDLVENTFTPEGADQQNEIEDTFFLSNIHWIDSSLSYGFVFQSQKLAYFTEHQIFSRRRIKQSSKAKRSQGLTLKEIKQLQIGDFVVHEDKGIGKFDGFQTIEISGNKQDCMRILFAEGDLLYVHLNYIHKVAKYSAQEGAAPKLSKLGSGEWLRKKARAKRKLKDIARDLIKLYAERRKSKGFAFPADDVWQKEFEASFFYEDTPDQARTTDEVKLDMMQDIPMDRLICGDVGFGKTEIAIRAAFKAATSGKQTAVLVPTTILAQQHFSSFKDRINRYPVKVEVMSRFRSKKEQEQTLDNLKTGKVDILIGTHRILSKDISFKNLGLLVIDEEHRFGVGAKEKLRQLRASVDTLTLTATPIPRTLNFSLMGARDLSIIETPPRNRLPVETEIIQYNLDHLTEIILNEVKRGGQVFFVNDRINGLEKIANDIAMQLPHVRFGIAHGQMNTGELEKIMDKFIEKKIDILYATKIIESGIDIPNANTMIINNANNFGLAELYQLRGRVGRADIQAFCYLTIPVVKGINRRALQRLQAIQEFTDLGSGLKLAMRDLEIRGAGNLLGPEQSGFIIEMGFELYQKVLDEAVSELKSEEFSDVFEIEEEQTPSYLIIEDIQIEIGRDAYFPDNYMNSPTDRFSYYKKLYNVSSNKELDSLVVEIEDRFGKMPDTAKDLVFAVRMRIAALETGFVKIILRGSRMIAEFPSDSNEEYYNFIFRNLVEYLNTLPNSKLNQKHNKLFLEIPIEERSSAIEYLWKIKQTIKMIALGED